MSESFARRESFDSESESASDMDDMLDFCENEEMEVCESVPQPKKPENKTPVTLENYQTITNAQHPSGHWSDVTAFNAKFDIKDFIWKKISDEKNQWNCLCVNSVILVIS